MWLTWLSLPCKECAESAVRTTSRFSSLPTWQRTEHSAIQNIETKLCFSFLFSDFSLSISTSTMHASQGPSLIQSSEFELRWLESWIDTANSALSNKVSRRNTSCVLISYIWNVDPKFGWRCFSVSFHILEVWQTAEIRKDSWMIGCGDEKCKKGKSIVSRMVSEDDSWPRDLLSVKFFYAISGPQISNEVKLLCHTYSEIVVAFYSSRMKLPFLK